MAIVIEIARDVDITVEGKTTGFPATTFDDTARKLVEHLQKYAGSRRQVIFVGNHGGAVIADAFVKLVSKKFPFFNVSLKALTKRSPNP
jgi:hypothetical protein